ncbi:MAG TPA: hypothetical protein VLF18_15310 [Tahibacter sp.]|uniref:hypothetical protein n=1 Tax=Tahibacter sp. TaxID=2056211 RepID=UPI002C0BADCA|nr:hypothetical protein [Tahibacter sp.]HSX61568.1 hypothetical protein [Tahibacter sp.]
MSEILHSPGVLALELSPGATPSSFTLGREAADALARHIADDLLRLLPAERDGAGADQADLLVLGALYDSVQLLHPGWPLFAGLSELAHHSQALAGAEGGRIVAFGSHAGAMPGDALQPLVSDPPSPLLLVPWTFSAPEALATDLGARMESVFMAKGEAGRATADFLMRTLGVRLEHARYLTRHDLCALICSQLEHAGYSALWQMLEFALLYPTRSGEASTARGQKLVFRDGAVHCALPVYADWAAAFGAGRSREERVTDYAGWLFELRQYVALLGAHGVAVRFDGDAGATSLPAQRLAEPDPSLPPPTLFSHEARGLGVVVISVAQIAPDRRVRLLAHAWPLDQAGFDVGLPQFAARYGASEQLVRLGGIELDATADDLAVTLPGPAMH